MCDPSTREVEVKEIRTWGVVVVVVVKCLSPEKACVVSLTTRVQSLEPTVERDLRLRAVLCPPGVCHGACTLTLTHTDIILYRQ